MRTTPITYWGGKQTLAPLIVSLIPNHTIYVEPFFGGGAVFFQKEKSKVEVINDLNRRVVNFYRVTKSNFPALQKKVQETLHSRDIYRDALVIYSNPHLFSKLDLAWAFYVACNQGRSGQIGSWAFGTKSASSEKRIKNDRQNFVEEIRERLEQVQIESNDALRVIERCDRDETFFYLDPPYHNAHMGHYGGYTAADFEALLQSCASMKGKFLLSSYPSDLLENYTKANGWFQIRREMACPASKNLKKKVEMLTANYAIKTD